MPRTKTEKKEIIDKVRKIAEEAKTIVFVNFHGIRVAEATKIRRKLTGEGVGFFVAKKSLIRKAFEGSKISGTLPELPGEAALVYGSDIIAPAREIYAFQREYKNAIAIQGGVFESVFADKDAITAIAVIPPLQTLYGMLANVINSPIQGLVVSLDQIARKKTA